MLEQLVECENRLLEEQRRFNELLLAWRSGDLGDDLTRMKIEQMQREVDALGRQLTALRTVIAAQADRERAGYRQGAMPKAAYGWPAYGQAVAAESDNAAAGSADSGDGKSDTDGAGRNVTDSGAGKSDTAGAGRNVTVSEGAGKPAAGVSADTAAAGGSTGGIPAGIREAGSGKNDRQGDSAGLRCRTDLPESGVFCDAGAAVS